MAYSRGKSQILVAPVRKSMECDADFENVTINKSTLHLEASTLIASTLTNIKFSIDVLDNGLRFVTCDGRFD